MFALLVWQSMKVYIDDMLVKRKYAREHESDMADTFRILHKHHMKFNLNKCIFWVVSGKLLGYLVHQHVIEANPENVRVMIEMASRAKLKQL